MAKIGDLGSGVDIDDLGGGVSLDDLGGGVHLDGLGGGDDDTTSPGSPSGHLPGDQTTIAALKLLGYL